LTHNVLNDMMIFCLNNFEVMHRKLVL